jgi:hypothetical protein
MDITCFRVHRLSCGRITGTHITINYKRINVELRQVKAIF